VYELRTCSGVGGKNPPIIIFYFFFSFFLHLSFFISIDSSKVLHLIHYIYYLIK